MPSGLPENMSPNRERAIDELGRGREWTNKLRDLLNNKSVDDKGLVGGEDLVVKILNSFANTLSMLRKSGGSGEYDEVSQKPNMSCDGRRSEDSGESIKSSKQKDRRGCYKRSKCAESWTKDTPALIDDGHAWRKYGEKKILNANHHRHYYRCTHSKDQLCQAKKHVQQIEDDPPKYRTIYNGNHTCTNPFKSSHILLDSPSAKHSSMFISFANNDEQESQLFSSFVKQEVNKESDHHVSMPNDFSSSSLDNLLSLDHMMMFSAVEQVELFSGAVEQAEPFSGAVDSVDFDALLQCC